MPVYHAKRFNNEYAPNKRDLSERFVSRIRSEITRPALGTGMDVVSLVGPNVASHFQELKPLLGQDGVIWIAESSPNVLGMIRAAKSRLPLQARNRLGVPDYPIDFYDRALLVAHREKPTNILLDADFCGTYSKLQKEFFKNINEIKPLIPGLFYVIFTRSRAHERDVKDDKRVAQEICNRCKLELVQYEAYCDKSAMTSYLFRRPSAMAARQYNQALRGITKIEMVEMLNKHGSVKNISKQLGHSFSNIYRYASKFGIKHLNPNKDSK